MLFSMLIIGCVYLGREKHGETGHVVHVNPVIVCISVIVLARSSLWLWITELCSLTLFARETERCLAISCFHASTTFFLHS